MRFEPHDALTLATLLTLKTRRNVPLPLLAPRNRLQRHACLLDLAGKRFHPGYVPESAETTARIMLSSIEI
jgi:hypothetical protein